VHCVVALGQGPKVRRKVRRAQSPSRRLQAQARAGSLMLG